MQDIDRISELDIKQVVTLADIIRLQQEAKKVYIGASIRSYIIDILGKLRRHPDLSLGPSPRGGIALFRGARGLASTQGRDFILPDDVKKLLVPTLSSRLRITAEALMVTTEKLTKRGFTTNTH